MPYYHFKEIRTPLKLLGLKFYVDDKGRLWCKLWHFKRSRLFG